MHLILKPTHAFSHRTPPHPRKLSLWHTMHFMRIHGETQTRRSPICGIEYQWHTVVQGPDNDEHSAATGPGMRFMQ